MKIRASPYFLMAILAVGLAVFLWTFTVQSLKLKVMPFMFSVILLILGSTQLSQELLVSRVAGREKEDESKGLSGDNEKGEDKIGKTKYPIAFGWVAGFILFITLIGFVPSLLIYVFSYMKMNAQEWMTSTVFAAVYSIVIWIVLGSLLKMDFFPGILFGGQFIIR